MRALALPLLLASAALAVPARAQVRVVPVENVNFDGSRARPEGELVTPGASTDPRTAEQIAKDEQSLADARAALAARVTGPDAEVEAPVPNKWLVRSHFQSGLRGGLTGVIIGSLWGMTGLGIGVIVGGLIGYGMSRFA